MVVFMISPSTAAIRPETDGSKLETKMGAAFKKNKHKDSVKTR